MKSGRNEDAVSPVIGVILMVAITVILAAVIAAFVFQMGTPTKTPTVNMQLKRAQVSTGQITLLHSGGEAVKLSDVRLVVYSDSSHKTTVNPLMAFGNITAMPAGSELILNFNTTAGFTNFSIDAKPYNTSLGTVSSPIGAYTLSTPGESITVEFWYIPSGQMLGRVQGATIP